MFTESELEPGNLCWPLPSPPANVMFPFSLHLDSDREPPPPPQWAGRQPCAVDSCHQDTFLCFPHSGIARHWKIPRTNVAC